MNKSSMDQDSGRGVRFIPTYEALAHDIKDLGVDAVFGLMSDDTAMFAVEIDTIGIQFYGARHENHAIAMAEGYAATTGRLGIAIIGRGPAAANGLHAAVSASRTGSKVLIIFGEAPVGGGAPNGIGPDYKAFNSRAVMAGAGLQGFFPTSPQAARTALADAVAVAMRGTVATLHLPTDVQLADIQVREDDQPIALPVPRPGAAARPQGIETALGVLAKSQRPVIIAGMGAHRAQAGPALEALADKLGALLITTARGKDMFRGNPNNLDIIGSFSHSMARRYVAQADCVLAFGAALNFLTMSFGTSLPPVPLIQVDMVRNNIGRYCDADVGLVGDAKAVAEQLLAAVPARTEAEKPFHAAAVRQDIADFDIGTDFQAAHTARTVDPRSLALELGKLLPEDRNVVYDAGNFLGVVPYIPTPGPGHFKMTNEFASIGLGFGTAMGVAKARPENTTVLIMGDGGFVMTLSELDTVAREDLPMVVIIMNDCAYGAELHLLRAHQRPVAKSLFPDVDFAPIAQAFGFEVATIRSMDDLAVAAPLLRDPQGLVFLDCKINADIAAPFMGELAAFEQRDQ
ncbi:MAG: thiamine pyrophosphate-binding protein [Alphaproteobacteria bacterium]|nr:thiamine pyrophosphate-binding protein [Alphaproteobacteria bacterium]